MEQNQSYQIRVSGMPHNFDVGSYSGLFGSFGQFKMIKSNGDNSETNKSNSAQQIILQYESLQAAQATIKEIKSQNSNLFAELIPQPKQQQNDLSSSTSQENSSKELKGVQFEQDPKSSSQKLSSSKSRSRSNTPKNVHINKLNQTQFSSQKNKGELQQDNNGLSIVVDRDNGLNSSNQYQFGYNSMLSQQVQDINGQNISNQQHFKDVSPQKNQESKIKSSESRERISNDNQSIESGEVPSNSRDQQNNDISQSQFSKDDKIIVSAIQVQQPTPKQTLTIIKQDRNQNINNNNSNTNNSGIKQITNIPATVSASAQSNNQNAQNPPQSGVGGARVITIKKKEQGPKLIDKLIIKQKPSQNDLEKPTVSTGSLENLSLQGQSLQTTQPQSSNFSYKIQNNQIISRPNNNTSNIGGLKTQKILRISQRENDGNNSMFVEDREYQLNINSNNNSNNNNKNNSHNFQKREFQSRQDIYNKGRYQINYINEEKYGYNQQAELQKQSINSNIQNYQIQSQNDYGKQKIFITGNQSNQQLNIKIQQQQTQNYSSQQQQQLQDQQILFNQQQQQFLSQKSQQQSQQQVSQQQPLQQQSWQFQNSLKQYQQYYSQLANSNNQQYLNQAILTLQSNQTQQSIKQPLKVIDIQAEKKKVHKLIHERIKLIHLRHQREKKKKYHCLHAFHRINCHQLNKSQQNLEEQSSFPEYLRKMDFLQFCRYFSSKLERSSSLSIEKEFFVPQLTSSKTQTSKSPQSSQNKQSQDVKQVQPSSVAEKHSLNEKIQVNNFSSQPESNQLPVQQERRSKQKDINQSGRDRKEYSSEKYQRDTNKEVRENSKLMREKSKDNRDYKDTKEIIDFRDVKENRDCKVYKDFKDNRSFRDKEYKESRDFKDNRPNNREFSYQQQQNNYDKSQYNKINQDNNASPPRSLRENNNSNNNNQPYNNNNPISRRYYKHQQDQRRSKSRSRDSRSNSFSRNQYKGNVYNYNGKYNKNYDKKQNKQSPKHQFRNDKSRYFSRSTSPDSRKGQQQYQQIHYNKNDEEFSKDRKDYQNSKSDKYYYQQDQRKQNRHNRNSHENSKAQKHQQDNNIDGENRQQNKHNNKSSSKDRQPKQNQSTDQMSAEDIIKNQQQQQLEQEIQKSTFSDVEDYKSSSRESQRIKPSQVNQNSAQKQKYDEDQLDYTSDQN